MFGLSVDLAIFLRRHRTTDHPCSLIRCCPRTPRQEYSTCNYLILNYLMFIHVEISSTKLCMTNLPVGDYLQSKSRSYFIVIVCSYNEIVEIKYTSRLLYNVLVEKSTYVRFESYFYIKASPGPSINAE